MKLLIITDYAQGHGLGSHNYTLYKEFQAQGHEVEILHLVSRHCFKAPPEYGINIVSHSLGRSPLGFLFGVFYKFKRGVRKHLQTHQYDFVIVGHQGLAYLYDVLDQTCNHFGIIVHDVFSLYKVINKSKIKTFIYNHVLCKKLSAFENVICLSQFTLLDYQKRVHSTCTKHITFIHSGFPLYPETTFQALDSWKATYGMGGKHIILHVGSEDTRKNIPTFLKIATAFQHDSSMLFVRVGEQSGSSRRFIRKHHLDNIKYFSGVSEDILHTLYRTATIFLYTSSLEGFGRPLVEAYLHHIPCISSPISDMPTLFAGSPNVHFVSDPYAVQAYVQLLTSYKDTPFAPETMDFSGATEVQAYVQFIHSCLQETPSN